MGVVVSATNSTIFHAPKRVHWLRQMASHACVAIALIGSLMLCGTPAFGQMNTGELGGTVRDASGGFVPGATVVAEQTATGLKYTSVTNDSGEYLFGQLPIGVYKLTATALGFKLAVLSNVEVHIGDQLRHDFSLEVGQQTDVVTVEASGAEVQLESAEIKDVIQHDQVMALPLRGRQFLDLAMLSEGVVRPPGGTRGDALQQAGTLVNILGQRSGHNLYLVDGVSVTDQHFNNMVISPSVDSISEFNISKTSYAPEFGGKSGAVINVVTKSGTNRLHGSLFEFVRNNIFDAKNFFDSSTASIPPFHQNQFGGTLGGPIKKDKTFFFVTYEGQRVRKSLTQTFTVPTDLMRGGNFSQVLGLPLCSNSAGVATTDCSGGNAPIDVTQTDGTTTQAHQGTVYRPSDRRAYVGNIVTGTFDPVATALLGVIPHATLAGTSSNLLATNTQSIRLDQYSARLDHQITSKDTAYARASIFDANETDPFGSGPLQETVLPGFGRDLRTHTVNLAAGWTHIFSTNWLNEFRFGWMHVNGGQTSPNAGSNFSALNGLQGVTTNPLDMGFPNVSFGGQFATAGDPALFTNRNNRDFEFYDNVVWHKGTHTLKFGGYWFHFNFQPTNPNNARGTFSFTTRWTASGPTLAGNPPPPPPTGGNPFADFLLGFPTTATAGIGRANMDAHTNWGHFYIQDDWQVTPSLKFDIGLRYEYNRNMVDNLNQISIIDGISVLDKTPGVNSARFVIASDSGGNLSPSAAAFLPLITIPYVTSKAAGYDRSLLIPRNFRLAPRLGLAWNPWGHSKTVLRAGVGIYPNQAAYSVISNAAQNLPFFLSRTVNTSGSAASPSFFTPTILTSTGAVGGNDLNHNFKIEYNEVWNANVEQEVAPNTTVGIAYIGSRTVQADSSTVLNVPVPGAGSIGPRRPIPSMSAFNTIRWDGWATYHALTAKVTRRMNRGLMFDANWTWSHSIDDASDPGGTTNESNLPQDVRNMAAEKGDSSFDHRHRFVVNFVYNLPFADKSVGFIHALFAQWQASGDYTIQSGAPFTVNTSSDPANNGLAASQRPNISGNPNAGPRDPAQWFNASVFSVPAAFTFGNLPRNAMVGPGLQAFDLALQKDFSLSEATRLQFRWESFGLFNHPNFNIPNRTFTPTSTSFGKITSAQDPRVMQFALRLTF
jgi:hypothetical protein